MTNNPFSVFGPFANILASKFGNTNNMFNAINGFASQFDPRSSNPEQMAQDLVRSGQMSQDDLNSYYKIGEAIYNMMGVGRR